MKKKYVRPETEIMEIDQHQELLAGTVRTAPPLGTDNCYEEGDEIL
jgi:hypothetical protein